MVAAKPLVLAADHRLRQIGRNLPFLAPLIAYIVARQKADQYLRREWHRHEAEQHQQQDRERHRENNQRNGCPAQPIASASSHSPRHGRSEIRFSPRRQSRKRAAPIIRTWISGTGPPCCSSLPVEGLVSGKPSGGKTQALSTGSAMFSNKSAYPDGRANQASIAFLAAAIAASRVP